MRDFWKIVLTALVLTVLIVFGIEIFFFIRHGYFLAIMDIFRLIAGR